MQEKKGEEPEEKKEVERDPEDDVIFKQMDEQKSVFKNSFQQLRVLKSAIENIQVRHGRVYWSCDISISWPSAGLSISVSILWGCRESDTRRYSRACVCRGGWRRAGSSCREILTSGTSSCAKRPRRAR